MKTSFMILAILVGQLLHAGDGRGEAGWMFLKVPLGARETSLGWTGLTHTSGAAAIYWNPANVSRVDGPTASLSYLNHFAGIRSNYVAATYPVKESFVLGISINYMNYGDFVRTTETSPDGGIGTFTPYDLALGVTFSRPIMTKLHAGLTAKYLHSKIDKVTASGLSVDFGLAYDVGMRGLRIGTSVTNAGPSSRYGGSGLVQTVTDPVSGSQSQVRYGSTAFELPTSLAIGASGDMYRNEENVVTGMIEQNVNSAQVDRTNFGVEYGYRDMFFGRVGYTTAFQRDKDFRSGKAAWGGFTAGVGAVYSFSETLKGNIDYGFVNLGENLGSAHRFTIGVAF
jgi:hypothetical protein